MNIKEQIKSDLKKIFKEEIIEKKMCNIHFLLCNRINEPGIYIFKEKNEYCYVEIGDRGEVENVTKSLEVKKILYKVYSNITFNEAVAFSMNKRNENIDFRRLLFDKQLELLKNIDEIYYNKRMEEIEEILLNSPYKDNI